MGKQDLFSTKKEAENYLFKLARLYEVPPPILTTMPTHPKYHGMFDSETWTIAVSFPVMKSKLRHEFYHYLLALLKRAEGLEEDLCGVFGEIKEAYLDDTTKKD